MGQCAGFTALVNQQAAASGKSPVGFLNPVLYAIGEGSGYNSAFHDITTGNNTSASSPSKFFAVAGYDLCTGWGTPTGSNLINALVTPVFVPIVTAGSWALLTESCQPTNGAVNPGELVTVAFALEDSGLGGTTNLIATLLATNGVTLPGTPQSYGALSAGGPAVSRPFSFVAAGACGSNITAVLQLQDGAANLGTVSFSLPLGSFTPFTDLRPEFRQCRSTRPAVSLDHERHRRRVQLGYLHRHRATARPTPPLRPSRLLRAWPRWFPRLYPSSHPPPISLSGTIQFRDQPVDATLGYDGGTLEIQIGDGAFADILAAAGPSWSEVIRGRLTLRTLTTR